MKSNNTKKCPRCGNISRNYEKKCSECGLVYSRLEQATNKEAKKQFFSKDRHIIMTCDLPKDVVWWKLVMLCFFLGLFGAHNLYVGRYYKGGFMFVVGILSLVISIIPYSALVESVMRFFFVFPAFLGIFWIVDLFNICFKRFKVPVALEKKWAIRKQ